MKKLFISFCFILIFIISNAATFINVGDEVTSAGTSEVELQFRNVLGSPFQTIYIIVDPDNTGTIQFSVGTTITSSNYAYPAGSRIVMTIDNGRYNLRYKASAASQSFSITQ